MNLFGAFDFLNKGGWVAWVLAGLSLFLWYGLGYRFLFLREPKLLSDHIAKLKHTAKEARLDLETALQFEFVQFCQELSVHRAMIRSIVIVAPLLGLLGTVIGMIETFDSLQDSALFSQSGGVAGGISQAMITTQMGLVVAIPGLLIGRKLDNQEKELTQSFEKAMSLLQLKGVSHEI